MPPPRELDADSLAQALTALRKAVSPPAVLVAGVPAFDNYRDTYAIDDAALTRPLAAVLPGNLGQLQRVLQIARQFQLPLWPLSTGRNLGYGGAAPRRAGAIMLDLKRMKHIVEVNEQYAYAVVEPGVSYLELHAHLRKLNSRLWLDPTASGWGGLLGNCLERGVGYGPYGQHCESQCGLQVLLADGTVVETALAPTSKTRALYRYGHRAWVDGLFNQSNYGIVTRIGVHLMPAPVGFRPYLVTLSAEDDLFGLLEALRPLYVEGVITQRATLMSLPRAAAYSVARAAVQPGGGPLRESARTKLMDMLNLGSWNLYGALYGAERVMDNDWRMIEKAVRSVPGARFYFADARSADAAFLCRASLAGGTPSMDDYKTLDWVGAGAHLDFSAVLPFEGDTALNAFHSARDLCHDAGFDYCAEFQLEPRSLRHEVRLIFQRDVLTEQRAAQDLHVGLALQAQQDGQGSPRAHLAFMDDTAESYSWGDNALLRVSEAIKDGLDPQGLLAPGKSGLWTGRYVQHKKK